MTTGDWTALIIGVAGVIAGMAAVPSGRTRAPAMAMCLLLIAASVIVGVIDPWKPAPDKTTTVKQSSVADHPEDSTETFTAEIEEPKDGLETRGVCLNILGNAQVGSGYTLAVAVRGLSSGATDWQARYVSDPWARSSIASWQAAVDLTEEGRYSVQIVAVPMDSSADVELLARNGRVLDQIRVRRLPSQADDGTFVIPMKCKR